MHLKHVQNRNERERIVMSNEKELIKERYSHEISIIQNRLKDLEQGLVTEIRGAGYYGSISTNIQNLRKELNDLFSKIVSGEESSMDGVFKVFDDSKSDSGDSK